MKKHFCLILIAIFTCITFTSCVNGSKAIIQAEATAANLRCPMDMGAGLTLVKVEFEGIYVTYYVKGTDEMYFSKELITPEMKNQIVQAMQVQAQSDSSAKKFLAALKKENVGIIYHYFNESGVMDVVIESRDL